VVTSAGLAKFTCTFDNPIDTLRVVFYVISASGEYSGFSPVSSSDTVTTNPILFLPFGANDSGTIQMCTLSKVSGSNRMLLCYPSMNLSDANGSSFDAYRSSNLIATSSTAALAWYDKPRIVSPGEAPINGINESLAIDSSKSYSVTISERYYGPLKKILNNPMIEAYFRLPLSVFQNFNFGSYIYIKTKDLQTS